MARNRLVNVKYQVFMKKQVLSLKQPLTLSISMIALIALSGCETWHAFTGERNTTQEQALKNRRVPALNASELTPPAPPPAVAAPSIPVAVSEPISAPAGPVVGDVETNPYDRLDAKGEVVKPQASAQDNFFTRLFAAPAVTQAKKEEVRKPIAGNPHYSTETAATAPIPAGPQNMTVPVVTLTPANGAPAAISIAPEQKPATTLVPLTALPEAAPVAAEQSAPVTEAPTKNAESKPQESWFMRNFGAQPESTPNDWPSERNRFRSSNTTVVPANDNASSEAQEPETSAEKPIEAPAAAPVAVATAAPVADAAPDKKPSWFPHWFDKHDPQAETEAGKLDITNDSSSPPLSSVPPMPTEFGAVKNQKQKQVDDLQSDHQAAQQAKQQLDSEPSQQNALVPVEAPAASVKPDDVKSTPAAETPKPVEKPTVDAAPAKPAEKKDAPVSDNAATLPPLPVVAPAPEAVSDMPKTEEPVLLGHVSAFPVITSPEATPVPVVPNALPPVSDKVVITVPAPATKPAEPVEASPESAVEAAPAAQESATPEEPETSPAAPAKPLAEHPSYWWQKLNPFTHESAVTPAATAQDAMQAEAVAPVATPAETAAIQPSASVGTPLDEQALASEPAPVVPGINPAELAPSAGHSALTPEVLVQPPLPAATLPSLEATSAPVAPVAPDANALPAAAPVATSEALPSPQLLKNLAPSGYAPRQQPVSPSTPQ